MATNTQTAKEAVEQSDVAVDVLANDLVLLGTDSLGYAHYHDRQRDRIVVADATHDEFTCGTSGLVRRSLVVTAADVDDVVPGIDSPERVKKYLQYVAARVEDRSWESITVQFVDAAALLEDS